jgi:glycyl-tRNA synthetase
MFKTFMGPVEEDASTVYLRPETAQGIFVNFNNVINSTRKKLPFGIAQIGKAFRNEITTGNFIFRTREFEMMEIEYFVMPGEDEKIHDQWIQDCLSWYSQIGLNSNNLRVRRHEDDELSHYAKATYDIEYNFPWGWGEIQGIANRTDYDLKSHMEMSGEKLTYFDESSGQHVIPYVIEPSWGVDRAVMALLVDAYCEEELTSASGKIETRVVLKFDPSIAPVKAAVLPLSRNEKLTPLAKSVFDTLRRSSLIGGHVQYDDAQSIGRRYRRQDEIGTPLCVTVDFDSLDDDQVTIRERDSMQQTRVGLGELESELAIKMKI